ncbi:MAG: ABC transporter permease [Planctomycetota bacterium]|nr:ABC transporter permease [Planctomycetota bacterium]
MSSGMWPRLWATMAERRRAWLETLGPAIALLLIYGLFSALVPKSFPTLNNLEMMARQTVIVGMAGLGMTLIMIMGGIDLSAGSIVALSTVVTAWMLNEKYDPTLAALGGVAVGALCGWINGLLVTGLRLVPFIATLGMMLAVRGVAKGVAKEQKIDAPASWLPELTASLREDTSWMLLPPGVWMMLVLALAVAGLLRYTRLGRHIFAIGSNEQTARLCGVAVERVKLAVYTLGAAFMGLAGLMQFSRLTVGDPTVAQGLELDIIAAVVIGGGSLSGGKGSILGTLVGALIMTVVKSGCVQMGIKTWVQEIITGLIIVVAVALDRWRESRKA